MPPAFLRPCGDQAFASSAPQPQLLLSIPTSSPNSANPITVIDSVTYPITFCAPTFSKRRYAGEERSVTRPRRSRSLCIVYSTLTGGASFWRAAGAQEDEQTEGRPLQEQGEDGGIKPPLHKPRVRFFALGIKTVAAHNMETIGLGQTDESGAGLA